jgi:hypothetical protein
MKKASPTNDLIFRKTFASKGNEDILAGLAKDFFLLEPKKITINNPYSIENYYEVIDGEKQITMRETIKDVSASFETEDFISELQVQARPNYPARALFYALSAYAANYGLNSGETIGPKGRKPNKYSALRNIYSLNFLGFEPYADDRPFRIYQFYDVEGARPHAPENVFVGYFEYRKMNNLPPPHKHWSDYINGLPLAPDAPDYIKKAVDYMDYVNLSEEERRVIDAAERWQADIDAWMSDSYYEGEKKGKEMGKEEGIKIGEIKGRKEGEIKGKEEGEKRKAIVIAAKCFQRGDSIEQVAEVVDLPIETLVKIQRGEIFDI